MSNKNENNFYIIPCQGGIVEIFGVFLNKLGNSKKLILL